MSCPDPLERPLQLHHIKSFSNRIVTECLVTFGTNFTIKKVLTQLSCSIKTT